MLTDPDIPFRVPGTFQKWSAIWGLLVLMACSACGGSTADNGDGADSAGTSSDASCGLPNFQGAVVQAINTARAQARSCGASGSFSATSAVAWHSALGASTSTHSADMASRNLLTHTGSNGSTIGSRVTAAGYAWSVVAENIASNYPSVDSVMTGWLGSPGHCANLMNPNIQHVGAACVAASNGTFYWTLDLAKPL